jgi:hypothetical protein
MIFKIEIENQNDTEFSSLYHYKISVILATGQHSLLDFGVDVVH